MARPTDDIEKMMLAAQSRVTYQDIVDMPLDEAKRYAATAPKRQVEQGLTGLEAELEAMDVDPEEIVEELEDC
jgi:hypothetical protein